MTDTFDIQRNWDAYYAYAVSRVQRGFIAEAPQKPPYRTLFAILHEPSFEDIVGWEIFDEMSEGAETRCFAHRTTWKQMHDYEKIFEPADRLTALRHKHRGIPLPTIEYATVTPNAMLMQDMVRRVDTLRVPLKVDTNLIGCDGRSYELILGHAFSRSRLRWWVEAPVEWAEAGAIVMETLSHLEALYEAPQR